jgi:hypothetical protein
VVKSLVRRWDGGRLGMLNTIREYAVERLEESAEADDIRRRHAEFFLGLAEGANLNPNTYDPTKPIRHDLARREQNEIYGALSWALQTGSVVLGLRLASAVGGWLWSINYPARNCTPRTPSSSRKRSTSVSSMRAFAVAAFAVITNLLFSGGLTASRAAHGR